MARLSTILIALLAVLLAAGPADAQRAERVYFAEIKVEGTFGEEITAYGLEKALEQCKKRRVTYVIFKLESPGGYLYEANAIMDLLREYDEDFEYVTIIEKGGAFSAACTFIAMSHHLFIRDGGSFGGATAYSTDNSTGATEVDAKLNSIWASGLASAAESRDRSGLPFRAMVEQSVSLYANPETGEFSLERPGDGWEEIDGRDTVLTMRAEQAVELGVAQPFNSRTMKDLAEPLGVDPAVWQSRGPYMNQVFTRAGRDRVKLDNDISREINNYNRAMDRIPETVYPSNARQVFPFVNQALQALTNLARMRNEAEETGALHIQERIDADFGHELYVNLDELRRDIAEELER